MKDRLYLSGMLVKSGMSPHLCWLCVFGSRSIISLVLKRAWWFFTLGLHLGSMSMSFSGTKSGILNNVARLML